MLGKPCWSDSRFSPPPACRSRQSNRNGRTGANSRAGCCRTLACAAARRPRWDDGSGRLCLGRWKTDAEARTVYLTPAAAAGLGSGFSGHSGRVDMARRMAAGKRRGWWRSIGARRRRAEPRNGWRRSVAAFMDCPPATLSAADGLPRAARRVFLNPLKKRLQRLLER